MEQDKKKTDCRNATRFLCQTFNFQPSTFHLKLISPDILLQPPD